MTGHLQYTLLIFDQGHHKAGAYPDQFGRVLTPLTEVDLLFLQGLHSFLIVPPPDGSDIVFADETMTKLDHEIEKYDNSTGELIAWVRVPLLSSSTDTDIHLYYGNPSSPDQSNKTGVWDANYLTVLHMNNDPEVPGVDQIKDSSLNSYHFTNDYGLTSGDSVDAYIGKGLNMVEKGIRRSGS